MKYFRIGVYVIALFLFQEIALRLLFPVPEIKNFNRINYIPLPTLEQGKPVRNMLLSAISLPDTAAEFIETLNNYGFRDNNWKMRKQPGKQRIMLVGDSFVEGILAEDDETIAASFLRLAGKQGIEAEVMNMGIATGNLNTYSKLIADAAPLFRPDYVIMLVYANDSYYFEPFRVIAPLKPELSDKFAPRLREMVEIISKKEMLPFRFPFKKSYFITAELINRQSNQIPESERFLKEEMKPYIAEAIRQGKFDPNNVNIIYREEEKFQEPFDAINELAFLKNYCHQNEAELIIAYLPSRNQVTGYYYAFQKESCSTCPDSMDITGEKYKQLVNAISRNCNALKIPFLDLSPLVEDEERKGNHLYWNYDGHMRGRGYEWTGEKLFEFWKRTFAN